MITFKPVKEYESIPKGLSWAWRPSFFGLAYRKQDTLLTLKIGRQYPHEIVYKNYVCKPSYLLRYHELG